MHLSEKIEVIIFVLEQSKADFDWYDKQKRLEENRQNNLMHEIEGVESLYAKPPAYKMRAALATELQKCLLARRFAKDASELNRPIAEYIDSDCGKKALNALKQRLGDVRKIENNMKVRQYYHRETDNSENINENAKQNLDKLIKNWKKSLKE